MSDAKLRASNAIHFVRMAYTTMARSKKMVTATLIPLNLSRGRLIPQSPDGKTLNCSTLWRWHRKGLAGLNGERIKLEVVYVGRTPHVDETMVKEFFDKALPQSWNASGSRNWPTQKSPPKNSKPLGLSAKVDDAAARNHCAGRSHRNSRCLHSGSGCAAIHWQQMKGAPSL